MSRKLLYVSGLLACFRCHLDHSQEEWSEILNSTDKRERIVDYFHGIFRQTPLEIIAGTLLKFDHLDEASKRVFDSYDQFLGLLAQPDARTRLEALTDEEASSDQIFEHARSLSHTFRDGLLAIFFDPASALDELTKNYGVF